MNVPSELESTGTQNVRCATPSPDFGEPKVGRSLAAVRICGVAARAAWAGIGIGACAIGEVDAALGILEASYGT